MRRCCVVFFTLILFISTGWISFADDWPQFQGPERDGISRETGLARSWPDRGPPILWEIPVGKGYGATAIRDGEAYFLDREEQQAMLRCLELNTGEELWRFEYGPGGRLSHDGSRAVPTVEDKYIYFVGAFGGIYCLDRATRKIVWHKELFEEFDGKKPNWGLVQSPVIYRGLVIVAPQCSDAGVVALDKGTGELIWKSPGVGGRSTYATPALVNLCGVDQLVMNSGGKKSSGGGRRGGRGGRRGDSGKSSTGKVFGISVQNGEILWSYEGWQCSIPIPHPIHVGENRIFVTGGYGAGAVMLAIEKDGNGFRAEELFKLSDWYGQIHQPILYKGVLFCDGNGKGKKDGLVCLDLDGTFRWRSTETEGGPNYDRGGLLIADGLIYVVDADGYLRMVEANPDKYVELGAVKLLGGKEIWAPLALSGGKLIIRDHEQMKCLSVK